MNKQELINELAKYIERLENVRSDYEHGRRDAYRVALESAKKLDEPQKPVVPKCFDIDYKKYKYMENNKAEILLTAMGGIYRVSFPNSFRDDLEANAWKTGIKWNKWTKETILWASRNYADFCQAVILGEYEVEKEPLKELLYEVVFLEDENDRYLLMELNEHYYEIVPESENDGYRKQYFTEKEIKAIDERYWAFAVSVEEVVER
ncbi:TPA: DUF1642 domain-containing protein [Enterococcus hirae]